MTAPEPAATPAPVAVDENQIVAERRAKLAALRTAGQAFPNDFRRDALAADLHAAHGGKGNDELEPAAIRATVAGRMMLKRVMGKACFATLQDMSGRIQLYVTLDAVGAEVLDAFKRWDLGDIVGATGTLFKTKTGELSIKVASIRLLAKSLRPLPEKFHGMTDQEQRYRQRYVDLITNPDSRRVFVARSGIVQAIREFFVARGYLEVETPMMHPIPGGAAARPFVTHHNALDMELFLRIAPELYLKKLVVGGLEKVFEINRNFRNEGISTRHNPEFTMIEFYEAYQDYRYLMDLTEALFREVALKVTGSTTLTYQGTLVDLGRPFDRLTMAEAIHKYHPQHPLAELARPEYLKVALAPHGVEVFPTDGLGLLQLKLFEATTEDKLVQPTFIVAHPTDVSPLARASDANPAVTDRFELFITGREFANGFSELNDPEDQAARFQAQVDAREAGDEEAMYYDADYLRAMEYGLPPTAGEGIGVDRLVMLLTDSPSIRDVILFPQLKREG
ncbi:MAG: lysine--tRNA ligase [Betaproteobacteria bacterium]|jgi:lysyl-tRNA synthetase class 2|nr:lysine--tRNA ligase [Betaproteobacteria bacterium]MBK7079956.1 lysine--tRNA ligase [Betaproteobacteria bacterium]MBK7743371.1 lysine--tRNA ligase [Betaproteobacteria bacterium]